jgi:Chlorophyll A-B binding protein
MKFIITALSSLVLVALSSVEAFAPPAASSKSASVMTTTTTTALNGEKVPCFGAAPLVGDNKLFLGEPFWNWVTSDWGSEDTGKFLRAAELKHCRSAMIATVGFAFEKFGITFDKFSPHAYLSVTQNIKFSDLAAMSPVDAIKAVPDIGLCQIFCTIAAIEIYELTHGDGEIKTNERVAPGWQSGGLTGDLGWNPLKINVTDRRRLVELQNGRAAMFAISAWVAAETIPGSVPIPLLW